MAIAVVLVLLVIGSLIFHFASPWWFTPIASNWATMDDTVVLTFWVTGIVFIAVNLFLAWVVWKYRHRKGQKAAYEPERKKLEWGLTVVTSVGVAAMLAPGLVVWHKFVDVPEDAAIVGPSASSGTGASASRARMASSATATPRSSPLTTPSASTPTTRRAPTTCSSPRRSCTCRSASR
jgi:heme/copper-type cytochrome/quinol oxidase subunit 2